MKQVAVLSIGVVSLVGACSDDRMEHFRDQAMATLSTSPEAEAALTSCLGESPLAARNSVTLAGLVLSDTRMVSTYEASRSGKTFVFKADAALPKRGELVSSDVNLTTACCPGDNLLCRAHS